MKHIETCPHCGGKLVKYRHTLSRNLTIAITRLYDKAGTDPQHVGCQETGLTPYQWNNLHKAKYWGLIREYVTRENEWKRGWWHVTLRGEAFLFRLVAVRRTAITFRGEVMAMEGDEVKVDDLLPGYKVRRDYIEDRQGMGEDDLFSLAESREAEAG